MELNVTDRDRAVYEEELSGFLPEKLLDIHTHVGLPAHFRPISPERYRSYWAVQCGYTCSFEELEALYRACFPSRSVSAVCFPLPIREAILPPVHEYIAQGLKQRESWSGLCAAIPPATRAELVEIVAKGDFIGFKPYPDLVLEKPWESEDVYVEDYVSDELLTLANEYGLIVMLHLGRKGRLTDPDNIRAVKRISRQFPNVALVVAHLGRAVCPDYARDGVPQLAPFTNVHFDLSTVLNVESLKIALSELGPERLHFGTDLPLTTYHGRLVCDGRQRMIYAREEFEWNKVHEPEAREKMYTLAFYELVRCIRQACNETGMTGEDVERIFHGNSRDMVENARAGLQKLKKENEHVLGDTASTT